MFKPVNLIYLSLAALIMVSLLVSCQTVETPELSDDENQPGEALPVLPTPAAGTPPVCPGTDRPLVTSLEVFQAADMAEPTVRMPFRDPVFGTCLARVTDWQHDLVEEPAGLKNAYSRVQAFNADGSLMLVMSTQGNWYIYAAETLQFLGQVPLGWDPRWDAVDPYTILYSEDTRLMRYHLESGETSLVHQFTEDFPGYDLAAVWTRYEGSPSADGRYWGLMAQNQDWSTVALLVYDLQQDQVTSRLALDQPYEIDNVSISPLGNYFLAFYDNYCAEGELGTYTDPCGLMVYNQALRDGRGMLRIVGHSDLALDAGGREVFVYQDIDTDTIASLDLESGTITPLYPIDFSHTPIGLHISGQAFNHPGWVVVSTHDNDAVAHTWMDDQVFLLELVPDGRVVHLAHTQSLVDQDMEQDYWAEPHATVDRDLRRVLFTSNWGHSGSEDVEMYMILLPLEWEASLEQ